MTNIRPNPKWRICAVTLLLCAFVLFGKVAGGTSTQQNSPQTSSNQAQRFGQQQQQEHSTKYQAFIASFAVIVVSEIGDKTFLIAAILAMKNSRLVIFFAASSALVIMTVLSAGLGYAVPNLISRHYTQLLAAILFFVFGVKMFKDGWEMDESEGQKEMAEVEEELAERGVADLKRTDLERGTLPHTMPGSPTKPNFSKQQDLENFYNLAQLMLSPIFVQTFAMTFLAEWGDRSQIATIALAAAEDVFWVTLGASLAHCLCTGAAVMGGRLLAARISVRTVTLVGGLIFVLFSIVTFAMLQQGSNG